MADNIFPVIFFLILSFSLFVQCTLPTGTHARRNTWGCGGANTSFFQQAAGNDGLESLETGSNFGCHLSNLWLSVHEEITPEVTLFRLVFLPIT